MTRESIVEKFICPGCVAGSDTKCGKYKPGAYCTGCESHVLGTVILPAPGNIALGMPKGFNRPGDCRMNKRTHNQMLIRVWAGGERPEFDRFNIPVWALKQDGFLFVRTVSPRVAQIAVDIIEGGMRAALCPQAVNVNEFYEEMD